MLPSQYPVVVVVSLGHSGSRLLVRILDDSGILMGRRRGRTGEDEYLWSRLAWSDHFRRAYLLYALQDTREDMEKLLVRTLARFVRECSRSSISHLWRYLILFQWACRQRLV